MPLLDTYLTYKAHVNDVPMYRAAMHEKENAGKAAFADKKLTPDELSLAAKRGELVKRVIDYTDEFATMIDALDDGKYYAFADLGGVHALLVAETTFDYGEGITAGSSAYVYVNNAEGTPVLSGDVTCGGTAYAVCVFDGKLMYGNRAEVTLASIGEDNALVTEAGSQDDYENATVVSFIKK